MPHRDETRETQFENLVDGQFGKAGGADRVAGGEHVDKVAIELSQGLNLDPVGIAGYGF